MTISVLHGKPVAAQSHEPPEADFGDPQAELSALISGCGVYPLSRRAKIVLTGEDRVRWLNGMVTNNVRDLAPGRGVYAFLLNPQGRILADLYAYNRGDSLLLDTDQFQLEKMLATFEHYIIMDDVGVKTSELAAIGIAGPNARDVLRATGIGLPELATLQVADLTWGKVPVTIVRGDNNSLESFELCLTPVEAQGLREALIKVGAKPAGTNALDLLRIACGIPRYGRDIRERDLPQETEQHRALNFTKGCYIGQEIVERIRSRGNVHRKFTGFVVEGPLPAADTKIQSEGKDIGEITSVASLPLATGPLQVALGYIRRESATSGKALNAGEAKLTVVDLPFKEVFQH